MSKWKISKSMLSAKDRRETGDQLNIKNIKQPVQQTATDSKVSIKQHKNNSNQKNYAFIDSQNLNIGTQSKRWQLDYQKFYNYLVEKYFVKKAFLFIGYMEEHESLYDFLTECGYHLIYKKVLEIENNGSTTVKGNVDAELVLHAALEIDNYDQAVIVTGDGDFYALVEHLHRTDKLKKLIVPNDYYSTLYADYEDYIEDIGTKRKILSHRPKSK